MDHQPYYDKIEYLDFLLWLHFGSVALLRNTVNFDDVLQKAIEYKLGARGLRSLCEAIFTDAMFEMPSSGETNFKVTKPYAEEMLSHDTIKKLKAVS